MLVLEHRDDINTLNSSCAPRAPWWTAIRNSRITSASACIASLPTFSTPTHAGPATGTTGLAAYSALRRRIRNALRTGSLPRPRQPNQLREHQSSASSWRKAVYVAATMRRPPHSFSGSHCRYSPIPTANVRSMPRSIRHWLRADVERVLAGRARSTLNCVVSDHACRGRDKRQ